MNMGPEKVFFSSLATAKRARVDEALDRLLPREDEAPRNVHAAMRWSVFAGGKRFRPILVLTVGETFGAPEEQLLQTACAFELIHTYSLIHDDLPSMDDDDLRRGKPTCHVKYGEAAAILAGDALQTLAFEIVSGDDQLSFETRVRLISEISRAAGTPHGMVAGQEHDLEAERKQIDYQHLEAIHRSKTGALITAAARCGAIIAQCSSSDLATITDYGSNLGLLFQITDDLLDVTSTAEALGKTPGKDARAHKATYASVFGIDQARERAQQAHNDAQAALKRINQPTDNLCAIADFLLTRES